LCLEANTRLAGYTGDSLSLKIIIALLIGLALYNAVELIVLVFVTFNRYKGLYFWSLIIAGFGVIPYALGFLIKFFQLLDPNQNVGYVAVFFLTIGWYMMISGKPCCFTLPNVQLSNSTMILKANPSSSGRASTSLRVRAVF
jgi:hypothetical protein